MHSTKRLGFLISCCTFALANVVWTPSPADAGIALREIGRHGTVDADTNGVPEVVVNEPSDVAASPDDAFVYVTDHDPGNVLIYDRINGSPTGDLSYLAEMKAGVCTTGLVGSECQTDADCATGTCLASLRGASTIATTPDGACTYVGSDILDTVTIFSRDPVSGLLSVAGLRGRNYCALGRIGIPCDENSDCDTTIGTGNGGCLMSGLRRVADLVLSPNGANLYVLGATDNTLTTFARVAPSCELILVDVLRDGVNGVQLRSPFAIAISPDQANVYVSTSMDESIAIFDRDDTTGALSPTPDLSQPTLPAVVFAATCVDPVETNPRKACNNNKDCVGVQEGSGQCVTQIEGLFETRGLAVSPDGAFVYAAARGLPIFDRDQTTGHLSLSLLDALDLSSFKISGGTSIAITREGDKLLYGTREGRLLLAFARDTTDGSLRIEHSHGPVDARAIATTGSGPATYAYVAGGGAHVTTAYDFLTTIECPAVPRSDCSPSTAPGAAKLILKDNATKDSADAAIWKWSRGEIDDLGFPLTDDSYAFCLYSTTGAGSDPVLEIEGRIGPGGGCSAGRTSKQCWSTKAGKKSAYRSPNGIPQGVRKTALKAGLNTKGKIKLVAKGAQLEVPLLSPLVETSSTLTTQLMHEDECWTADFGTLTLKGEKLVASSD